MADHGRQGGTPRRHPPVRALAIWLPIALGGLLFIFVVIGIFHRIHARREQTEVSKQAAKLSVSVVQVKRDNKPKDLVLPGNIQAFQETTIYPRSNGYVKSWKVDIGDDVKEGQLLAEIETPEVDQQLAQAKANYDLADATATRWRDLATKKVVSDQDRDEKETAKRAAQANLEQLQKTQAFNKIVAPFGGKISFRRVDVGALVSATTPLFGIEQNDPLRVYVFVPQPNAASIREGLEAKIQVPEKTGEDFTGFVTRTAGALDPLSRTMQAEVQVPNHEGKLYAGMYAQVKFSLPEENAPLLIPANAFMFRTEGPQVAVVSDEKIHWQTIRVGRDFGTNMEVLDGLKENSTVVNNPTDDLPEGLQVEVKQPEKKSEGSAENKNSGDEKESKQKSSR
jgi:membrane fusion protein, multidrug efflux system